MILIIPPKSVGIIFFNSCILMGVRNEQLSAERSKMLWDETSEDMLMEEIQQLKTNELERFFRQHLSLYTNDDKAFSKYMRHKFREKGISQKDAFKKANMSEGYGYKIISQEKKTAQRDVIIRLCLALRMNVAELQKALVLGGFSLLCVNHRRDVIIMVAVNNKIFSIEDVNMFLTKYDEAALYDGNNREE